MEDKESKRCVLTTSEVRDIFLMKHTHGHKNHHAASIVFGKKYRVSSKTIRDIWNGRCWFKITAELWSKDDPDLNSLSNRKRSMSSSKNAKATNDSSISQSISTGPSEQCRALEPRIHPHKSCVSSTPSFGEMGLPFHNDRPASNSGSYSFNDSCSRFSVNVQSSGSSDSVGFHDGFHFDPNSNRSYFPSMPPAVLGSPLDWPSARMRFADATSESRVRELLQARDAASALPMLAAARCGLLASPASPYPGLASLAVAGFPAAAIDAHYHAMHAAPPAGQQTVMAALARYMLQQQASGAMFPPAGW